MEFLAKAAYYAGSVISGLLITFFFLSALFTPRPGGHGWRETAVALAAAAVGYGLLALSFRLGHQAHHWLAGLGVAVAALAVAGAVLFLGLLMFGKVHWQ